MADERAARLRAVEEAVVNLTQSPLYDYRVQNDYQVVFGAGNPDAAIMFIGEAPGKKEAETGLPFVGASGRVLDEMLGSVGIRREDVYITSVVKDRPPNNRDPRKDEIALYAPFLDQQIDIIQPKVIATLGRFGMRFVLARFGLPEQDETISVLHGRQIAATASYGAVTIVPLYHPAVALYNASQKGTLLADFAQLKAFA